MHLNEYKCAMYSTVRLIVQHSLCQKKFLALYRVFGLYSEAIKKIKTKCTNYGNHLVRIIYLEIQSSVINCHENEVK